MFASLFSKTNRMPPARKAIARKARLEVETLEGRALMSTLAGLASPALAAIWPPPPPAQAQVRQIVLDGGFRPGSDATGTTGMHATGARPSGDEIPMGHAPSINLTVSTGEEIPQRR